MVIMHLEKEGFEVIHYSRGDEVIEGVRENEPDLVLLDIKLPGMSGIEIIKAIKADFELAHIPVVFFTANDDKESVIEGIKSGALDYIIKPYNREEFISRIKKLLS